MAHITPDVSEATGRNKRFLRALAVAVLLWLILPVLNAAAHGDGQRQLLQRAPVGELFLDVWVQPAVLRPGEIHFVARVTDDDESVVDGCQFRYDIRPLDGAGEPAVPMPSWSTDDESENAVTIDDAGRYGVTVTVAEPGGVEQRQYFELEVTGLAPAARWFLQGLALLSLLVGAWLASEGARIFGLWQPAGARPPRPGRQRSTKER